MQTKQKKITEKVQVHTKKFRRPGLYTFLERERLEWRRSFVIQHGARSDNHSLFPPKNKNRNKQCRAHFPKKKSHSKGSKRSNHQQKTTPKESAVQTCINDCAHASLY